MSLTDSIKKSLGIPTDKKIGRELTDDTFDNTDGPSSPVDLHAAGPTTDPNAKEEIDDETELTEAEAMAEAAEKLGKLELGEGSWSLVDRALDSIARNSGTGLDDPDAVARAKQNAALARIADGDLNAIIQGLIAVSAPADVAGNVYSYLYGVLKQAVFFANLDYRFAEGMDQYSDEAAVQEFFVRYVSSTYVEEALGRVVEGRVLSADDTREFEQERRQRSDQGFEDRREIELAYLRERYGAEDPAEAVKQALEDLHLFFGLTVESLGWDSARPLPYGNVREADGKFTPITDVQNALDAAEISRQASQKRRREKRAADMANAAEAVAAIMAKSLQRPTVHRRK